MSKASKVLQQAFEKARSMSTEEYSQFCDEVDQQEGVVYLYRVPDYKRQLNYDMTFYTDVSIGLKCFDFYLKGSTNAIHTLLETA